MPIHQSAEGQLGLPGLFASPLSFKPEIVIAKHGRVQDYLLFLAIRPEPLDALALDGAAEELCKQHGLAIDARQSLERLHVTLHAMISVPSQ